MKYRILARVLRRAMRTFPAVVVTGPRQSGKTTLLRSLFRRTHEYVSLEDPDTRIRAREDPRGFLEDHAPPVVLDEIQHVPELLPYIKTRIDDRRRPGDWVLTGSQNFVLMLGAGESLAGRAAVLSLLPFCLTERMNREEKRRRETRRRRVSCSPALLQASRCPPDVGITIPRLDTTSFTGEAITPQAPNPVLTGTDAAAAVSRPPCYRRSCLR